nr:MAG TPA: hypothetical protein [Caudoviricetes sp.]
MVMLKTSPRNEANASFLFVYQIVTKYQKSKTKIM